MPITPDQSLNDIERDIQVRMMRLQRAIIRTFLAAGEKALNAARSTKSYKDQTGNLRSSIGYVVVADGQIVRMSDFALSEKGSDRMTGQATGKDYIKKLVAEVPTGVALIMVAGMNYAVYVQKRFDVLDSSELTADKILSELLPKLDKGLDIENL